MSSGHPSVDRIVLRQPWQNLHDPRSVAPISHQIAHDAEQTDELHACISHAVVGHVANELGHGAGRFDVGPDTVAVLA